MRVTSSYLIAAAITVGLAGWLLSGQLGSGDTSAKEESAAVQESQARPVAVRVRQSVAEPVERELVVNARSEPARAVELRAETSGRVVAVGPKRGDRVEAGEVLVSLDRRERDAMLSMAEAAMRQRKLEYEAATRLGEKGFQAETEVAEAAAALEAAAAELERIRVELDHTEIRAPFAGILELRPVEIGDYVDAGDPVAMVIEQDPFLIVGHVSENEVGQLQLGMTGKARLLTGRTVEGRLRYIASQADPATRTFTIELEVPNPDGRFMAGVSAELKIAHGTSPAHRVPASLLSLNDEGVLGVKSVDGDGVVAFHPADILRADGEAVWLAGLPDRVRLITAGQGFVRAGDQVRPVFDGTISVPLVAERPA
jgi:membrane fusion protein, multidrug efflux system